MKKIFCLFMLAATMFIACGSGNGECRIHGRVTNPNLEGACIYLIAEDAKIRDSVGIDSAFIKDGKFDISTKKNMMGILRLDYHYRYGNQDLLVVEEPGDVYVTIDSISNGGGTVNNDKLQQWKGIVTLYQTKVSGIMRNRYIASHAKDSVTIKRCDYLSDSLRADFTNQTSSIVRGLDDGPLKDFFHKMFSNLKD